MERLNPDKLQVTVADGVSPGDAVLPRRYTLTHSDFSGQLFLTIGGDFNRSQTSGWYVRLMRDEVLAELVNGEAGPECRAYCHVNGGLVFGTAALRNRIFRAELRLALEAIRYGDRDFLQEHPAFDVAPVIVCFRSKNRRYACEEQWGTMSDYR